MATSNEEQRAIDYRLQMLARSRFKLLSELQLRGNPTRRLALRDAWSPVAHRKDEFNVGEHS